MLIASRWYTWYNLQVLTTRLNAARMEGHASRSNDQIYVAREPAEPTRKPSHNFCFGLMQTKLLTHLCLNCDI